MGRLNDDDEQELINAEFNSMVEGLNLDQSSDRTYLDELDEFENSNRGYTNPPELPRGLHQTTKSILSSIKKWFHRGDADGDGAVL